MAAAARLRHLVVPSLDARRHLTNSSPRTAPHRLDAAKITRRIRAARFPAGATLEEFDFGYNPKLPAAQIRDLARLEFIAAGEGVLAYGPVVIHGT